jgi:hypothetical protein
MIKKIGQRFQLWTKSGSRALGPVTTKTKAKKQEVAIAIAKASRGKGKKR